MLSTDFNVSLSWLKVKSLLLLSLGKYINENFALAVAKSIYYLSNVDYVSKYKMTKQNKKKQKKLLL